MTASAEKRRSLHGEWYSRLVFVLAVSGSAVGLGNIRRFPYWAGENGAYIVEGGSGAFATAAFGQMQGGTFIAMLFFLLWKCCIRYVAPGAAVLVLLRAVEIF